MGRELEEESLRTAEEQLRRFRQTLEEFATKHRDKINKDPAFRHAFQQMAREVGIDPLASSKGFWASLLGVGDFYFELGVRILGVCLATRPTNGGLLEVGELERRLQRGPAAPRVSKYDIQRALETLVALGKGVRLHESDGRVFVLSVPLELSSDHTALLALAGRTGGSLSVSQLVSALGWTRERAQRSCERLVTEGLAWVDDGGDERSFWIPSLFFGADVGRGDRASSVAGVASTGAAGGAGGAGGGR